MEVKQLIDKEVKNVLNEVDEKEWENYVMQFRDYTPSSGDEKAALTTKAAKKVTKAASKAFDIEKADYTPAGVKSGFDINTADYTPAQPGIGAKITQGLKEYGPKAAAIAAAIAAGLGAVQLAKKLRAGKKLPSSKKA